MKIEDLKNTKIYLSNEEDRVKFQKKVFRLGVKWSNGSNSVHKSMFSDTFFTINEFFNLSMECGNISFICKKRKQVFLEDVLAIEEPKVKFKPYDRVLMRDNNNNPQWMPTLFASYYDHPTYQYIDITRTLYRECIPYEGNEYLVGTTKSKDE